MYTADGADILKDGKLFATTDETDGEFQEWFERAEVIARALNREAAMGEVREAALKHLEEYAYAAKAEMEDWEKPETHPASVLRQALAALDAAEVAP